MCSVCGLDFLKCEGRYMFCFFWGFGFYMLLVGFVVMYSRCELVCMLGIIRCNLLSSRLFVLCRVVSGIFGRFLRMNYMCWVLVFRWVCMFWC